MCVSRELVIQDCLAHKNTTIVFSGTWKNNDIVFKTKREPHHFENLEDLLYIELNGKCNACQGVGWGGGMEYMDYMALIPRYYRNAMRAELGRSCVVIALPTRCKPSALGNILLDKPE